MDKSGSYYSAAIRAPSSPNRCVFCKGKIVYGDRCPDCAHALRQRHDQRRKRKRR
jgi:hypothetical protein